MDEEPLYCTGCQTTKAAEMFSRNRFRKTGRGNWCKACIKGLWQRPENLTRRKDRRNANLPHSLAVECRARARKRGIPCDITAADLVIPAICPVLGIPIEQSQGKLNDNTPTVDRIDPTRGYVRGNVAVISWLANRIKSDCGDPAVFEAIAAYMRRGVNAGTEGADQHRLQAAPASGSTASVAEAVERPRRPSAVREDGLLHS